jgi:hypothetical protein
MTGTVARNVASRIRAAGYRVSLYVELVVPRFVLIELTRPNIEPML